MAEAFVDEVSLGEIGPRAGRAMLDQALTHGVETLPDAPLIGGREGADQLLVRLWIEPEHPAPHPPGPLHPGSDTRSQYRNALGIFPAAAAAKVAGAFPAMSAA